MRRFLDLSIFLILFSLVTVSACTSYPVNYAVPFLKQEYSAPARTEMSAVTGELRRPYGSVCRINTLRSYAGLYSSTFTGSAAVLENGFLLTAAHNFYKPFYPSRVVRYNVQCGVGVNAGHSGYSFAAESKRDVLYEHPNEFRYHRYPVDFALVATCEAVESSFRLPNDFNEVLDLIDKPVITAGFPAERAERIQGIPLDGTQMFHTTFKVERRDPPNGTVKYALPGGQVCEDPESGVGCIDTFRGQSGSPLWIQSEGEYVLVGVHVAESEAVFFNQEKIDWLKSKVRQLSSQCETSNEM